MRAALFLCLALLLGSVAAHADEATGTFPTLETADLNKRKLTLPADLPGDPTLAFVAYYRKHQGAIDEWVDVLAGQLPGVPWIELPVVGKRGAIMRGFINGGMRSGIKDESVRARTITLFEKRSWINENIGLSTTEDIHVIVINRDGSVPLKITGSVTEEKLAQLLAFFNPDENSEQGPTAAR